MSQSLLLMDRSPRVLHRIAVDSLLQPDYTC
jgi:hypothetical protein